jgi:hypothetical protein
MAEKAGIASEVELVSEGASDSGQTAKTNEKSGWSIVEKALQILSITFVLTYISGYLVTSTFLNSYGIAADASEFLKARYLFVGFLYLLFLGTMGIAFGFFAVCYDRARKRWANRHPIKLKSTTRELKKKYIFVWTAAGLCFASSESIQITFLSLSTFRDFILLQTGLLASFLFYQLTNARSLHHPGWDRHKSIFIMRGWTVLGMVIFAVLPVVFLFCPQLPGQLAAFIDHHKVCAAAIFNILLGCAFRCAFPFFYTGESLQKRLRNKDPKQKWWEGVGPRRTVVGGIFIFAPANLILFAPYQWRWFGLQWANLFLSTAALASILFVSISYTRDRERNKEALSSSENWSIWLLRIATAGTLYVASTIGYANVIYPRVPFGKSGGDFATASVVRVQFHYGEVSDLIERESALKPSANVHESSINGARSPVPNANTRYASSLENAPLPEDDRTGATGMQTRPNSCQPGISTTCDGLVILEESPDIVYFARLDEALSVIDGTSIQGGCGPRLWKSGMLDPKGPYRPHLIAVSRRNIISIEEIEAVSEAKNCH